MPKECWKLIYLSRTAACTDAKRVLKMYLLIKDRCIYWWPKSAENLYTYQGPLYILMAKSAENVSIDVQGLQGIYPRMPKIHWNFLQSKSCWKFINECPITIENVSVDVLRLLKFAKILGVHRLFKIYPWTMFKDFFDCLKYVHEHIYEYLFFYRPLKTFVEDLGIHGPKFKECVLPSITPNNGDNPEKNFVSLQLLIKICIRCVKYWLTVSLVFCQDVPQWRLTVSSWFPWVFASGTLISWKAVPLNFRAV